METGANVEIVETQADWKTRTLLIGAALGALTGLGAAYLLVQRAERENATPEISAGEGIKLGLLLLGMLKQVAQLGE